MSPFLAVVSRSPTDDAGRRAFEGDLAECLVGAAINVLVVPHIYDLHADHPAVQRMAGVQGRLVVASWLYGRAAEWTLRWRLNADRTRNVRCLGMRDFPSAAACGLAMERILRDELGAEAAGGRVEEITDAVRSRWYPVLDYDRCKRCRQCLEFCLFGVYSVTDAGDVLVTVPDACKPGCPACARVCPAGAIMFPHHEVEPVIAGADAEPPQVETPASNAAPEPTDLDALIDELDGMEL